MKEKEEVDNKLADFNPGRRTAGKQALFSTPAQHATHAFSLKRVAMARACFPARAEEAEEEWLCACCSDTKHVLMYVYVLCLDCADLPALRRS